MTPEELAALRAQLPYSDKQLSSWLRQRLKSWSCSRTDLEQARVMVAMPRLSHWPNHSIPYAHEDSEVLNWVRTQPVFTWKKPLTEYAQFDALRHRAKKSGLIYFDHTNHLWGGVFLDKPVPTNEELTALIQEVMYLDLFRKRGTKTTVEPPPDDTTLAE